MAVGGRRVGVALDRGRVGVAVGGGVAGEGEEVAAGVAGVGDGIALQVGVGVGETGV